MQRTLIAVLLAVAGLTLVPSVGVADTIGFQDFGTVAVGTTDESGGFKLDVTDEGAGLVSFLFDWGTHADSGVKILTIHFDDGNGLLSFMDVLDLGEPGSGTTSGVDYDDDAKNFPQGNNLTPVFNTDFGASGKGQSVMNNSGEKLEILFTGNFANVIADLKDGDLRVGLHIGGFANGGSDSYVTGPTPLTAPEPATALLMGAGLLGLVGARRRRKKLT